MYSECRWACKWCAMETGSRCRRQADDTPAARRGTLAAMFERSISDPLLARYTPIIHSRDPWIVSFETFLSGEEAERIIKVGGILGLVALAGGRRRASGADVVDGVVRRASLRIGPYTRAYTEADRQPDARAGAQRGAHAGAQV